jgi:predicted NAD/FAD-dependent oxidoreductase
MSDLSADVLVVGAGICGLMAAERAQAAGARVVIVDKGRSVGGRLATRRIGEGRADHGAQFFTVRNPAFEEYVRRWREANLVFQWSTGWSDGSLGAREPRNPRTAGGSGELGSRTPGDGHPRYAAREGMNMLAKHLAGDVAAGGATIHTNVKVAALRPHGEGWAVTAEDGGRWNARVVVLTPPAPQARALLAAGGAALAPSQEAALAAITYAPCLCAMFEVDGSVWLPAPGAVQRPLDDIGWIADNQRKGISPGARVLTLHGSPAWSAAHYDDSDDELVALFREALTPWLDGGDRLRTAEIKRWRYALPTNLYAQPFLRAEGLPPLFFGGDGFGAPRVEGAALSGLAMGEAILREWGRGEG